MKYTELLNLIAGAKSIVVIQADNPDGDSLSSSLALENMLADQGKKVTLYCGVDIPSYLRYMSGWDRVVHELPKQFDLSIIVDTAAISLLEMLKKTSEINWLRTKPCVILDHHATESTIDFAKLTITEETVSTGELIYNIASEAKWEISIPTAEFLASSILSDSLGLTSEAVTARSVAVLSDLIKVGVSLAKIDSQRRTLQKKSPEITKYKGELLGRIEYEAGGRLALVHIPWPEIERYSHAYNPSMLVLDEMRMVQDVELAVAFKTYPDGRITAKIRSNYNIKVADKLAEHFGGGGHAYAAGFKITDKKDYSEVRAKCISIATELLDALKVDKL